MAALYTNTVLLLNLQTSLYPLKKLLVLVIFIITVEIYRGGCTFQKLCKTHTQLGDYDFARHMSRAAALIIELFSSKKFSCVQECRPHRRILLL